MRKLFLVLFLFLSVLPLFSFEIVSGNQYKINLVYENDPQDRYVDSRLYTAGIRVPVDFSRYGQILPTLLFSTEPYEYLETKEQARPCDFAFAEQMQVLSFFIDFPIGVSFPIGHSQNPQKFGLFAGPSCFIRIPAYGPGSEKRDDFFTYFFGDLRYFYANTLVVYEIPVSPKIGLTINAETEWPIANTWLEHDLGFWNEFVFHVLVGIRFY